MSYCLKENTTNSWVGFANNQYGYLTNPDKRHYFKTPETAVNIVINHSITDKFLARREFSIYHTETNSLVCDNLTDKSNRMDMFIKIAQASAEITEKMNKAVSEASSTLPLEEGLKNASTPYIKHSAFASHMVDGEDIKDEDGDLTTFRANTTYQASDYTRDKIVSEISFLKHGLEKIVETISAFPTTESLSKEVSDYNAQVVDILHYIEFSHLDACNGYLAFKELQDVLIARRIAKEKMEVINKLENSALILNKVKAAEEQASKTVTISRNYHPRSDNKIFE